MGLYGFAGHATQYVVAFAMAGLVATEKGIRNKKTYWLLIGGALIGLSVLMKQSGIFFFLPALYLCFESTSDNPELKDKLRKAGFILGGFFIPFIIFYLIFSIGGGLQDFWFWTITYGIEYGSQISFSQGIDNFFENTGRVTDGFGTLWVIGVLGLAAIFLYKQKGRFTRLFLLVLFGSSFLTIVPGLYFRPHYFVTLLPAIAVLSGVLVAFLTEQITERTKAASTNFAAVFVYLAFTGLAILMNGNYFFSEDPVVICRDVYRENPFPEAIDIAKFIKDRTNEDATIAVIGSEPEIYFLSGRKAATGHIYTYPLMEKHDYALKMQQQMTEEIAAASPEYLIMVAGTLNNSWLQTPESERYLLEWLRGWQQANYKPVRLVEIYMDRTMFIDISSGGAHQPESPYYLLILKRNR